MPFECNTGAKVLGGITGVLVIVAIIVFAMSGSAIEIEWLHEKVTTATIATTGGWSFQLFIEAGADCQAAIAGLTITQESCPAGTQSENMEEPKYCAQSSWGFEEPTPEVACSSDCSTSELKGADDEQLQMLCSFRAEPLEEVVYNADGTPQKWTKKEADEQVVMEGQIKTKQRDQKMKLKSKVPVWILDVSAEMADAVGGVFGMLGGIVILAIAATFSCITICVGCGCCGACGKRKDATPPAGKPQVVGAPPPQMAVAMKA
jgi:hypothetical protein